ncbi:putative aryl-alcohol dehydrogenase Aad14 [Thelonectria olida]|uniref:Aryl-alcohol dehydrogenase Aad14 n=1 Tax=Thelonectria olida TaxID=1576542 RepID=A0A9P9AJX4_9HYPO|nr:putative aryl-alcohol dehydrogenase Aad14 [Thelonectria olida]
MPPSHPLLGPAPEPATELGRYRILSPSAGIRVSPLQLGAMSIGSAWSSFMGSMDKEQSFKLLDAFVEAGGNFIDTANNYQNEESEAWLGEWMKSRSNRSYSYGKGKSINFCGNHKRSLHMSVRDSLEKLQTNFIDILYLHWWDYTTSVKEIMDSLHILVEQGKVLYLGISDSPAWIVSAANTYARAHGKTAFSIYQGRWNVMRRDFEREIIPMARHFGMALAPWDVLGQVKFQTQKAVEERKQRGEGLRSTRGPGQTEEEVRISEALEKVAAEHGIESVTAIALAYVMAKAPYVFPIVGGRKIEHLHDNIQALSIKLTKEQVEYLESVQHFDIGFPGTFIGADINEVGHASGLLASSVNLAVVKNSRAIGYETK